MKQNLRLWESSHLTREQKKHKPGGGLTAEIFLNHFKRVVVSAHDIFCQNALWQDRAQRLGALCVLTWILCACLLGIQSQFEMLVL